MEALDIAFISKFISREYAPYILESLAEIFEETIIDDLRLKMDVAIIFGGMILKQIQDIEKQNKLLEMINMRQYETDMEELVYDEYGDILNEKDKEIEKSIITNFRKNIWAKFVQAIKQYEMIQDGDKIAVCISGGKDSNLLAKCLQELKRHGKDNFELEFLCMNPRI